MALKYSSCDKMLRVQASAGSQAKPKGLSGAFVHLCQLLCLLSFPPLLLSLPCRGFLPWVAHLTLGRTSSFSYFYSYMRKQAQMVWAMCQCCAHPTALPASGSCQEWCGHESRKWMSFNPSYCIKCSGMTSGQRRGNRKMPVSPYREQLALYKCRSWTWYGAV